MEKSSLIDLVIQKLQKELAIVKNAAKVAHEGATHEESQAEDKYDTRGLELSYLAGAQMARVKELENAIFRFQDLRPKSFRDSDEIAPTALVTVRNDKGQCRRYFLLPFGSGMELETDGQSVFVVTTQSAVGQELLYKSTGEWIEIPQEGCMREFEILEIC